MKKKNDKTDPERKNKFSDARTERPDAEKSLGSSNAFDATENPQKDKEREISDEELDDLIDENEN